MTAEKHFFTVLLAVCVVLLALNIIASPQTATGQYPLEVVDPVAPTVVSASAYQVIGNGGDGWGTETVISTWSDGMVDRFKVNLTGLGGTIASIEGPEIVSSGSCAGDCAVRDGVVDVTDLLALLAAWGACP